MKHAWALLAFAACSGAGPKATPPRDPPASPTWTATTCERLSVATARARLTKLLQQEPDQGADAVAQLDWRRSASCLETILAGLPVEPRDWFAAAMALETKAPPTSVVLLGLAGRSNDPALRIALDVARLRLATERGDTGQLVDLRLSVLDDARRNEATKLYVLGELSRMHDNETLAQLCTMKDASIAWPCAEQQPGKLADQLDGIAKLPVLSFADADRLKKLDTRGVLPGLQCLRNENWRPRPKEVLFGRPRPRRAEEVVIYHRLSDGAPPQLQQCFLEQAASACLDLIDDNKSCPLLFSLADYIRTLGTDAQDAVIDTLILRKGDQYRLLRSGSAQAATVLFHLHLVLAEALVGRPPRMELYLPQYHVQRAFSFRKDTSIPFGQLMSPSLRDQVCGDPQCAHTCGGPSSSFSGCVVECKIPPNQLAQICAQ